MNRDYKIAAIGAVFTVLAAALGSYFSNLQPNGDTMTWVFIFCLLAIVLLLISDWLGKIISLKWNNTLGEFVYESMETILDYQDDAGREVSHDTFVKISRIYYNFTKIKEIPFTIYADFGEVTVDDGHCLNAKLISPQASNNEIEFNIKLDKQNIFDRKSQYAISTTYVNEYNVGEFQVYDIPPKYLCKEYTFRIIHPDPKKKFTCKVFRTKKPRLNSPLDYNHENMQWQELSDKQYISTNRYGRKEICFKFYNVKNTEAYSIQWKFT